MDIKRISCRIFALISQSVSLLLQLAGLAAAVVFCYFGYRAEKWWGVALGVVWGVMMLCVLISDLRKLAAGKKGEETASATRHNKLDDEALLEPATRRMELPYCVLAAQFAEYAPHDHLVSEDEGDGFLAWKDEQEVDIHIQSLEGEDWVALFWSRFSGDRVLSDEQLEELARREGVELPEHFRKMDADAFVHYREGELRLYPAHLMEHFEDPLLKSLMGDPATFRRWLEEVIWDEQHA